MNFTVYTPNAVESDPSFVAYIFDIYAENMYDLFGDDLKNEESRSSWVRYNLRNPDADFYWRLVLARAEEEKAGFLIYTLPARSLMINDIQIAKTFRYRPHVLYGLFRTAFRAEQNKFDTIEGYINDRNVLSQNNFLRYADRTEKTPRGTHLYISKDKIFRRFPIASR